MAKSTRSYLLEQLRAQADAVATKRLQQLKISHELIERLDRRLHAVFQYFDEACKLLQVICPPIEREFVLGDFAHYEGLAFERGNVMFRKQRLQDRDVYDYVIVYYTLTGPAPAPFRVAVRHSPEVEAALNAANLEFQAETDSTMRGGAASKIIRIAPGLRCEIRFDPDFETERIVVTLRNVDRFEPVILDFQPEALETRALDDLVNLMLGKPSQFLLRAPLRGFSR
jgi:hypothetical protein